jgi:uncharacterized membrane protein YjjP (DUF1212 family)
MNNSAMNFDIKALLTLLLLKSGTSSKDIQTAINMAAAARLMAAEECAEPAQGPESQETNASNVTKIRPIRNGETEPAPNLRKFEPQADAMNSDIKALLTLLLLQHGASSREIQTTLRMAAAVRGMMADEPTDPPPADISSAAVGRIPETRPAPKQAGRNDHLAPIPVKEFVAA